MKSPTPTDNPKLLKRLADFDTLIEALDYAAKGQTGFNFFSSRGDLTRILSFEELAVVARDVSQHFLGPDFSRGDRVAILANTNVDFLISFFACQYSGIIPVPVPPPTAFGRREAYTDQICQQILSSGAKLLLATDEFVPLLKEATQEISSFLVTTVDGLKNLPKSKLTVKIEPENLSYIQYSSGSTRFPKGVAVSHRNLMANCVGMQKGVMNGKGVRAASWLPFYHDLGLVGFMMGCLSAQTTVDYLSPEDFAKRPLTWLGVIDRNRCTLSYSPSFGYELCCRRQLLSKKSLDGLDLSCWSVAGIGGDMIKPQVMEDFSKLFRVAGFSEASFNPSYGLAECVVGASFCIPGEGLTLDHIDKDKLMENRKAISLSDRYSSEGRTFVACGRVIDGHQIQIRDDEGKPLEERSVGSVFFSGPSVMEGYFNDPEATAQCIRGNWLDTGDLGYLASNNLYIVGRLKDIMIVNGRNFWPQDVEWAVEKLDGIRSGDVAAFTIEVDDGDEVPTVLVQFRKKDKQEAELFIEKVKIQIKGQVGLDCRVVLVYPRSLPKTTSGKLSRRKAKEGFLSGIIKSV